MSEETFFREVDEDYRREQFLNFLRRYGVYALAVAFAVAALVLGHTWNKSRQATLSQQGGDRLTAALQFIDEGKSGDAEAALQALSGDGPPVYKALARLHLAAEAIEKKDRAKALALYREAAGDVAMPDDLRDFSTIQASALQVESQSYDQLAANLESYRSGRSPWRFAAKEIMGLAAMRDGKKPEAERLFGEIASDGEAAAGQRQRAELLLELLTAKPKPASTPLKADGPDNAKVQ